MFFLAGDFLDRVTPFAGGFVRLDAGAMGSMILHVHGSTASRLRTSQMFMLKDLDETTVSFAFLFRFHRYPPFPELSSLQRTACRLVPLRTSFSREVGMLASPARMHRAPPSDRRQIMSRVRGPRATEVNMRARSSYSPASADLNIGAVDITGFFAE